MATTGTLQTRKLTPTVGAEVLGVDVERLRDDDDLPGAVMAALEENGVLVFRGLRIDDGTQVAFCKRLGEQRYGSSSTTRAVSPVSLTGLRSGAFAKTCGSTCRRARQ